MLPKPKEPKSRLPGPKAGSSSKSKQSGLKQPAAGKNGAQGAKVAVVAKPVVRPPTTKLAKTEANQMMANQSSESSPGSVKSASSGIGTLSVNDDSSPSDLRERFELVRAPTAISEDLDEEEREEKACMDENSSEKAPPPFAIPAWPETTTDDHSSGSYSEGIEEQQIEFPDNVTDKSGDSLISSISSTSSEPNGKQKGKKKSGSSLSQLSNGSDDNFLIDDEIADQPGLTFDDNNYDDTDYVVNDEDEDETEAQFNKDDSTFMGEITVNGDDQTFNIEETVTNEITPPQDLSTLVQDVPPSIQGQLRYQILIINFSKIEFFELIDCVFMILIVGCEEGGREAQASPVRTLNSTPRRLRSNSTGTLSPCESITSDDLMLDFDESVASR